MTNADWRRAYKLAHPDRVAESQRRYRQKADAKRANRDRMRRARAKQVDDMDRFPTRCLHRFFATNPCRRTATHADGHWRACDLHRLPTDHPICKTAPASTEGDQG